MDPLATKMWHHKFDPHVVPGVPLADLKPQVSRPQRSESVKEFLNRSKLSNLIEPTTNIKPVDKSVEPRNAPDDSKLQEYSKKTGLSIETLKLIKIKQDSIK
jgi:hypothetical protein